MLPRDPSFSHGSCFRKWCSSVVLLMMPLPSLLHAASPARWADPGIPVTEGLELWLDASRENEAREAHYMNRLNDGQGMELWHDSSGNSRHLTQWASAARPLWRRGAAEFDGDDFMASLLTPGLESKNCTVFLVAAPEGSAGDFPSMLSAARRGENDYTSGLTIDFGREAAPAGTVHYLNVEGAGESGVSNLLTGPLPVETGHVFTVTSSTGSGRSALRVDGGEQGSRRRGEVAFSMDRVAVGARFVQPEMRHFFKGRIAEILFYNRVLTAPETASVEAWLTKKHAPFLKPADPNAAAEIPLVLEKNAPPVQMLVPGFRVDELPVKVTNLNNIEYGPDGKLFAGGYDGRFHLLRDTDGDGLEDRVDTFSDSVSDDYPLGMVVRDGMPHAVLADEIVRFRDTNGDGIPDRRETVAKGWDDPALRSNPGLMHRRVDSAMALAAGPDGSWYVTMGSANPGNGYWQKAEGDVWAPDAVKTGDAQYSPDKRRGCLLRIDADGKVTQLNSGLRYIMSLQWSPDGELFATDQEGATWLPNGNPFDELLHLQTGRHYGFPPRHPKLLPGVVDEPSVWNFSPQHQSACGFRFNGPLPDRARLGPEFWANDAIVTGESRGKLWRATLARTAAGYVADTKLFACAGLLIVDCAVSPQGDLVICCHSGAPDWGSGPTGIGRIFKIRYTHPEAAQPVLAWARDATTTVVRFNRPLTAEEGRDLTKRVRMEAGKYVSAGDRFEALRPGYAVVRGQENAPRYRLPVKEAALSGDGREVILTTAPRTSAVGYAVTLDAPRPQQDGLKQSNAVDVAFHLDGLETHWHGTEGGDWRGWLPHPDLAAAWTLTRGRGEHESLKQNVTSKPGRLTMTAKLDLSHLLQPAVQPGSKLNYTPEPEVVTITLKSDAALSVQAPGCGIQRAGAGEVSLIRTVEAAADWQDLIIELATPATKLEVAFVTKLDGIPRPLGIQRFHLPFATPDAGVITKAAIPEIAGGDPVKGHALFMGKATCFMCHQLRGEGHAVGPDLSNTLHRDYASVLRDITDPNATINPDAVAYTVELKDGTTAVGTRVEETTTELRLAAPGGVVTVLKKADVKTTAALPVSLMPPGLLTALDPQELKDLMAFLLTEPEPASKEGAH